MRDLYNMAAELFSTLCVVYEVELKKVLEKDSAEIMMTMKRNGAVCLGNHIGEIAALAQAAGALMGALDEASLRNTPPEEKDVGSAG
jgi:hypothetical protein